MRPGAGRRPQLGPAAVADRGGAAAAEDRPGRPGPAGVARWLPRRLPEHARAGPVPRGPLPRSRRVPDGEPRREGRRRRPGRLGGPGDGESPAGPGGRGAPVARQGERPAGPAWAILVARGSGAAPPGDEPAPRPTEARVIPVPPGRGVQRTDVPP